MQELIWAGPCDMSGYGVACLGYAVGLTRAGLRVKLIDRSQSISLQGKGIDPNLSKLVANLQTIEVSRNAVVVQHQIPGLLNPIGNTKRNVGYTIFEMTTIPEPWVIKCNAMDQIWTGSEYSKQSFVNSGVNPKKVSVVPHIIDCDRFTPEGNKINLPARAQYNFLSVFDFHSRKAWRELITAYAQAFKPKDSVCLWLKCYKHGFEKEQQAALIANIYKFIEEMKFEYVPRIEVCPFDLPSSVFPSFYRAFDCYVSISREGFGLPYAEAAASGLAIIGPEKSGTREFLDEDNSYVVDWVDDVPISEEMALINPLFTNLKWANHSIEHLSELMKHVYYNREEAKLKGLKVRQTVQQKLHYSVIGDKVTTLLEA